MAWHSKYKQCNACQKKISIELLHVTWHPIKWWDWCMSEDKTKETEPFFS